MNTSTHRRRIRPRAARRALLLAAVAALFAACQAVFGLFGGPGGPVFPHAPHIEEGLDCTACHAGAEEQTVAGYPESANGCMLCHKELDEEKPKDKTVAAFLIDGKPRWLWRSDPYGGEVRFDHSKHYEADLECMRCHAPVYGKPGELLRISGGKRACLECHGKTSRGNDCAVCHAVLRKNEPPPSHRGTWKQLHGAHSRLMIEGLGETTCDQCHEEEGCTQCHREEPPASHTGFWRRRGHGLTAAMDRTKCTTCHEPDYCAKCHRETQPMSHRGAFGPPRNLHCATCHLPAKGLGCAVCHTSFPAHVAGPNTPGNAAHMTAKSPGDCLSCHLALRHPNPGGDCRICHK